MVSGVNLGDALAESGQLVLEDVYRLRKNTAQTRIAICADPAGKSFSISRNSVVGKPGASIYLDSCLTFMSGEGDTGEAIVLVEVENGFVSATYLLPLSPIVPDRPYTLVSIDRDNVMQRFSGIACASFARGTHVLLADGSQALIETLRVGDYVMTRNHGPQPVKWAGQQTVRANGAYAPIVIRKGALNNAADLTLGRNHRLFIYQRQDDISLGQNDVTVRAHLLVDDENIFQLSVGFIDYFQLLFDRHEIIYVEGIAAETTLTDPLGVQELPTEPRKRLHRSDHNENPAGADFVPTHLREETTARILKRASHS